MSTNTILGAVLGLAVGVGAGWMLGSNQAGGTNSVERSKGGGGATPSDVAEDIPSGTWSKVGCGEGMAVDMLDDLQAMALDAKNAGTITAMQFTNINNQLLKCAINDGPFGGGDDTAHCNDLTAIMSDAQNDKWNDVLMKLTAHGH